MSDITVTFSKDRYIFGEDTMIEGKISVNPELLSQDSGDIEVSHYVKEWIFGKIIHAENLAELFQPTKFLSITNPNSHTSTYSIDKRKLKKGELSFQFDITTPNFYGDMWVSEWDGDYSCIVNFIAVTLDELDISERFPVRIEWESVKPVLLKKEEEKEVTDEDDFDEEEEKYDASKWVKVLWDSRLISESGYNDTSNLTTRERIGKILYELKIFWILYRILWIGAIPFYVFSLSEVLVTFLPRFSTTSIENIFGWAVVFFLLLRFYFVSSFKRALNKRSVALDIYDPEEEEENYFRECFRWSSLKVKQLLTPDYGDPLYPIQVSGKCEIGLRLWYEYTIWKNNTVTQEIIDKNIFKCSFSSLWSLMEKEIPLEKWINEVASIKSNQENLLCEITIDITYTWLSKERETIDLYY